MVAGAATAGVGSTRISDDRSNGSDDEELLEASLLGAYYELWSAETRRVTTLVAFPATRTVLPGQLDSVMPGRMTVGNSLSRTLD